MFSYYRTLSSGYFRQRWTRTLLIVSSIALGVATLVATRALHQSLTRSARNALNPLSGMADLVVVNGQTGVPLPLVERLRRARAEGVSDIQPLVIARALAPALDNQTVWMLGVSLQGSDVKDALSRDNPWGIQIDWTATPGSLFSMALAGQRPVLVTPPLAERLAARLPDDREDYQSFKIRLAGNERSLGTVGTVRLSGDAAVLGQNVVFMDILDAAPFLHPQRPEYVTQINVRLEPGADPEQVRRRLQEVAGPAVTVQSIKAFDAQLLDVTAGLELGFLLGSVGALVVGLFLVYNAMAVSVAERWRDIGILRSVGATRVQIAMLFVGEAFLLGLVGALLGLPLGYWIARAALGPLSQLISEVFLAMDAHRVEVPLTSALIALAAGIGTAILAALVPAVQAAQEEPANAVRRVPATVRLVYRIIQITLVAALISAGLVCVLLRERMPTRFGAFGGMTMLLIGALVATPLLAAVVGRLLQPLFRHVLGLPGRLAADNLVRTPGRTGLVVAALGGPPRPPPPPPW